MTNDDCLFFYHLSSFVSICPLRNDLRYAACCSSCHDCLQFCSDINHDHCCSDINHDRPPAINCSSCHDSPGPSALSLYCHDWHHTMCTHCCHEVSWTQYKYSVSHDHVYIRGDDISVTTTDRVPAHQHRCQCQGQTQELTMCVRAVAWQQHHCCHVVMLLSTMQPVSYPNINWLHHTNYHYHPISC